MVSDIQQLLTYLIKLKAPPFIYRISRDHIDETKQVLQNPPESLLRRKACFGLMYTDTGISKPKSRYIRNVQQHTQSHSLICDHEVHV